MVIVWASWCEVCERSLPGYARIAEQLKKDGVVLLALSADDEKADALAAVQERKYKFPVYWADKAKVKAALPVTGVPTVFVFDGDAQVLSFAGEGPSNEKSLTAALARLTSKR